MTHPDDRAPGRIPDDVPEADAVEQSRPAVLDDVDETDDTYVPGGYVPGGDAVPLETSEPDWQEQRIDVGLDAEDDFR